MQPTMPSLRSPAGPGSGPGADGRPILVVDDDPKIVALVRVYLERAGFPVITAGDGRTALRSILERRPSLVILDLMLPELDGMTVMRLVRDEMPVPILILSARGTVADRVRGLATGADDYLPKPFSPAELVVRVQAILRRAGAPAGSGAMGPSPMPPEPDRGTLCLADLEIDLDRHQVRRGAETVPLTTAEFRLLAALVGAGGRVRTRDQLLDALYGRGEGEALDRTVDVYVGRLREKLGDDPESPRYVTTVRGVGYRAAMSGADATAGGAEGAPG